ncbi:DUF2963 domain-containing protein, partial [Chrysanthemum yellows phytoplasma]|uniref:DUF2963 domain-containing protein n=1 Tax=Chrysanthemum yellows phytoplasma TaxID=238674 RepID=UPI001EE6BA5C
SNPQPKTDNQNQPTLTSKTNSQQEQETYNNIINKIEKEVDKLTKQQEQTPSLKYPHKTYYQNDGKTISNIQEHNQNTGIMQKSIHFYDDGKTIRKINEYNPDKLIKETYYNQDGTVKEIINH